MYSIPYSTSRKMLLRIREFPAGRIWSVLPALLAWTPVHSIEPIEVAYSPEVVFRGEPLTFRVSADPAATVTVSTNGVDRAVPGSSGGEVREIILKPVDAMTVAIRTPENPGWNFRLLRPGDELDFTERDGFLHAGDVPVILLPDHLRPPPLDRRWQTVEMIENALLKKTPPLPKPHLLCPRSSVLPGRLRPLFADQPLQIEAPAGDAWFRVHGYLISLKRAPRPFVAVEMDFADLERGMPFHVWLMKWQFTLQRLKALGGYTDGLLFGPEYTDTTRNWRPLMHEQLQSLARAHGLRFVDRSIGADVWMERLKDQLSEGYTPP